jgi:hypothetical protein
MKISITIQEKGPSGKNTASHTYQLSEVTGLDQAADWAKETLSKHVSTAMPQKSLDSPTVTPGSKVVSPGKTETKGQRRTREST